MPAPSTSGMENRVTPTFWSICCFGKASILARTRPSRPGSASARRLAAIPTLKPRRTQTVYKLDLPNASDAGLVESFKLLSGMIREPVLSPANVAAERPIILAERRERGGAAMRAAEKSARNAVHGAAACQPIAYWHRGDLAGPRLRKVLVPSTSDGIVRKNTVVVVVGDAEPTKMAALIERSFADWRGFGGTCRGAIVWQAGGTR